MNRRIKKKKAKQEQYVEVIKEFTEKLQLLTNEQAFETLVNAVEAVRDSITYLIPVLKCRG